ncbi:hypothetical protein RHSIM_Rhsim03G0007800 [Rhododendron simsii]|uniref:SUI1 domain-containing protein n=1 Tax=Rhododendron simsii TaxID=118357 RepID=A0A834LSZ7_RHOSS|nr:hypothetical protein RHSIM_Rhsim03G0007800 [Rhododendron simsii]
MAEGCNVLASKVADQMLQMGDKNSRFFHLSTIQRRQMNQIVMLKDGFGIWQPEVKEIAGIIKTYFKSLYSVLPSRNFDDVLSLINPIVTPEINESLHKKKGSRSSVAIKLDLNKAYDCVCWDFLLSVLGRMGFDRLWVQPFIHGLILEQQSAFITGRQIQDNIIVAHEIFHYLKHKKKGSRSSVAIKLDLNKAYDCVCWDFLLSVLGRMGFDRLWVHWIQQCVCTVKYSIYANGGQVCQVMPNWGLRQGDPLSPYLFLIVADVFSVIIQKAIQNKSIRGADMGKLYIASEATDVVFRNIEQENLDSGPMFISQMQAHHRITRGKESVVCKGALKTIQLMRERRQGNKKVTKLSGLESFLLDLEALASELQKKFSC